MKKHWLRGLLLGVSLSLLVAGGVALAQPQRQTTEGPDQWCLPCWPYYFGADGVLPTEGFVVRILLENLDANQLVCERLSNPPGHPVFTCDEEDAGDDTLLVSVAAGCDAVMCIWHGELGGDPEYCTDGLDLGEWTVDFWQQEEGPPAAPAVIPASAHFLLAEVCEVEFVPEPGTLVLLGSGLMGLAGYATLRWRTRE